jgi:two-component sensor histidine kinase/CheY-like chemotaxis protein
MTTVSHANDAWPPVRKDTAPDDGSDIELLHRISIELIGEQDLPTLYGKIVEAAIAITGSQFGTMQRLCTSNDMSGHGGELQLLASRGLPAEAIAFWKWVKPAAHSSCTKALKSGERAIIPDFELWDEISGTEDLLAFRRTGIRSAQTTPLRSRSGALLGMISTHWNEPHEPTKRDLRLLDILARQAADLLERTIADESLRESKQDLEHICAALRESEQLQKMLTSELSHRVKNMLATVQAIASQTLRNCDDPADFVESFGGRIQSMSRVHSQLSANDWKGTKLRDIVNDQIRLGPVDEAQISVSGPDVQLDAAAVPKMAMILHELGTNSLKYGALSRGTGVVAIAWTVEDRVLKVQWSELGGPEVRAPIGSGFGTRLIEASARGAGGNAQMAVLPGGVQWTFTFKLPAPQQDAKEGGGSEEPTPLAAPSARGLHESDRLRGKRILVVEDEPLLALDIAFQLEGAGVTIIGPASDATEALALIGQFRFDAAMLDANLAGEPVDAIADTLALQGTPFIFVSGYGKDALPASFPDIELLPKPFSSKQLLDTAGRLTA